MEDFLSHSIEYLRLLLDLEQMVLRLLLMALTFVISNTEPKLRNSAGSKLPKTMA